MSIACFIANKLFLLNGYSELSKGANTERTRGKLHCSLTSLRPQAAKWRDLLAMFANIQRQLCELKLAAALLKNHATALCVSSFTNTLNT